MRTKCTLIKFGWEKAPDKNALNNIRMSQNDITPIKRARPSERSLDWTKKNKTIAKLSWVSYLFRLLRQMALYAVLAAKQCPGAANEICQVHRFPFCLTNKICTVHGMPWIDWSFLSFFQFSSRSLVNSFMVFSVLTIA